MTAVYPDKPVLIYGVLDNYERELTERSAIEGYKARQVGFYLKDNPYAGVYPTKEQAEKHILPDALAGWKNQCMAVFSSEVLDPFQSTVGNKIWGVTRYSDALYFYIGEYEDTTKMMEVMFDDSNFTMTPLPASGDAIKITAWNAETKTWTTDTGLQLVMTWTGGWCIYGGAGIVEKTPKLKKQFEEKFNELSAA